jgi:Cu/Ag efflux pump CusA
VVWGTPESRQSLTSMQELLIDSPKGPVRLADVAQVRIAPTPTVIAREGVSRYIDVRANVSGRDVGVVASDVKQGLQKLAFPLEYHAVLLGGYQERQSAYWRTLIAALAAVVGIYLLLQACFQSWQLASLLSLGLLATLLAATLSVLVAGGTVHLGSLAGCLAALGLAARNGIALIARYQHLEREEGVILGPGLVQRGARERLGPILMSATAIAAALLPIVAIGDVAGLEILHPMAVVVLGGLIASAIVNLFVVPALYLRLAEPHPKLSAEGKPYG